MDTFNGFTLFSNKLFKYRFIGFIAIVFSIFFFNPLDTFAYIGEGNGVEFAGTNGAPIQSFNYDYNVNAYVENVKYIYMYFESNSIKGHEYEVMVDYAISYNRTYPISMGFIYAFEDEIIMPDLKSRLSTTEGQPDGGTGFYQRYNVTLNYTSVANNGHVRITIELPDVLNIWFYSVYNRTITDLTPINSDVVDSIENNTDRIIDNQNQNADAIIDNIDDLNNNLFDDEPLSESVIEEFFDGIGADFATDTPISDLILMPFTLLESYSDGISSTCSSFNLGSLLGTDLSIPCIDLESMLGSTLWTLIDMLFSVFMFYEISMLVISIFDSITSLDDGFQLLYSPRHGDMSRVGRGHSRGLY